PAAVGITSATPTNITCNGLSNGTIVITANGGTSPLQYSINNGITYQARNSFNNLIASNYQVIVKDANGCTQSSTATIVAPAAVAITSAAPTNITCNGLSNGTIVITANGGTSPLQYSINNGI